MADEADKGNDTAEMFLDIALRNQKTTVLLAKPNGHCFNCAERVDPWDRWCDADCRADWEKWKRQDILNRAVTDDEG